jgi:hypothetical protein
VLAALASLVLVSGLQASSKGNKVPSSGGNKVPVPSGNKTTPQVSANPTLAAELHATRTLLQNADHDYQGHRAMAVHHVGKAIHVLGGHHHHTQTGSTNKPTATPAVVNPQAAAQAGNVQGVKNPLPQEVSDAHLKQALQQLQTIQQQLANSTGKNHGQAAGELQNAIAELNTALKIK